MNWYSKLSDVVNLYVYNDAGKQIHKERALDGKIYNEYVYTLNAGTYYIVLRYVKNDYGNVGYDLKISEYDTKYLYNYSAIDCENSNEIKFNDNVKSLIYGTSVSDFTNYYKFKLEKATPISLKTRINDAKKDDTLTIRILNDRQFKIKEYTTDPAYEIYDYMDDTLSAGEYYISVTYNKNGSDSVWYDMILSDCNSNSYIKDDTVVNNINVDVDNVGIKLNKTSLTLKKGKKSTLKILNVYGKNITWKSSNKKIATVSAKGVVKAVKKGKAVITAKVDGKTLKCNVKVK